MHQAGFYECFTPMQDIVQILWYVMAIVPIIIAVFIWQKRSSLNGNELTQRVWYRVLTKAFNDECWFYQSVLLVRRLILVMINQNFEREQMKRWAYLFAILNFLIFH